MDIPAWSPDGSKIAYVVWAKGERTPQLYGVNPDGTGEIRLTDLRSDGMGGYSPSWSPDGSTIAIEVFEEGNWNLHLVQADGSGCGGRKLHRGCVLPGTAHSWTSSSSSGYSPVSTTTVLSSNEHHSCSVLSDRSRGHSAGSVYHPFSSSSRSSW